MSFDAGFRRSFEASDERSDVLSFVSSDAKSDERSHVTSIELSDGRSDEASLQVSVLLHLPASFETSFLTSFQGSNEEREEMTPDEVRCQKLEARGQRCGGGGEYTGKE